LEADQIDSSTIVAMVRDELNKSTKTFSVGFDVDEKVDELRYARQVAGLMECNHHEIVVRGSDFVEQAKRIIWHLDQPIADLATMATYMVAQLASQHVKVVLSGEGGDELFAGYARYVGERYAPYFRWLPGPLAQLMRKSLPVLPGMRRQKIALTALTMRDEAQRYANWFPLFNDESKNRLMTRELKEDLSGSVWPYGVQLQHCTARTPLNRMLYADIKLWLPDYCCYVPTSSPWLIRWKPAFRCWTTSSSSLPRACHHI
jgi:asparagine synthase (glutamine-hydrolysing)